MEWFHNLRRDVDTDGLVVWGEARERERDGGVIKRGWEGWLEGMAIIG
jgi:hypothetical protein